MDAIEQSLALGTAMPVEQELIYDLEVYHDFFLAKFYDLNLDRWYTYHETDNLLNEIIRNPMVTLIGFNNHGYDDIILKFIEERSVAPSSGYFTKQTVTTQDIYRLSCEIIQNKDMTPRVRQLRFKSSTFKSIDVKSLLDPLPSLKKLEIRMRYRKVQDLPIDPHSATTLEQRRHLMMYCENDVLATKEFYEQHALSHIDLRQFLADKFNLPHKERVLSMSEPKTAEFILQNEYQRKTGKQNWKVREYLAAHPMTEIYVDECIPAWVQFTTPYMQEILSYIKTLVLPINEATGYANGNDLKLKLKLGNKQYQMGIGGLHSIDKPGVFVADDNTIIQDSDVTSYYPSILLTNNLYPRGYTDQWNQIYREVYEERLQAKADPDRGLEAHALKIILNATFGKLSSKYSTFYDPTTFSFITITGQLGLLMLIERCVRFGIEVLSANTDGILVRYNPDQAEKYQRICKWWEETTGMNLEHTNYDRYARRDVNSYTALTTDGKVKDKGKFTEPDIKHDVKAPIIQRMARQYLLHGETPREFIFRNRINMNLFDFLFNYSATSTFKVFMYDYSYIDKAQIITLSKTNRWYIGKESMMTIKKQGGKLNNTVSIPDGENIVLANEVDDESLPPDLDYDYYIAKAQELIEKCGG